MENLNSDLVLEILSRLSKPKSKTDIKSLLQCRKVCKLWRRLLGKPKTGMLFLSLPGSGDRPDKPIELYYTEKSSEMVNFDLSEAQQDFNKMVTKISSIDSLTCCFRLVDSCNGLVCYKSCQTGNDICILNPITGERIRVSCMDGSVGFGYCRSTGAYKVLSVFCPGFNKKRVQVYTLGDGRLWRDKKFSTCPTFAFQGSGVFANGALHWLSTRSNNCDVVAFDLTDETFRSLPSPPCHNLAVSNENVNLGSVDGNLYLCLRYTKRGEQMMDMWVFQKKNMNCQHSVHVNYFNSFTWINVFRRKGDSGYKCQLLSLTDSEIVLWQSGFLSCYDRKATKLEKQWYAGVLYEAIPHTHSLVSLKHIGEKLVHC